MEDVSITNENIAHSERSLPLSLELAQATGTFYHRMIDICVTPQAETQREQSLRTAIEALPTELGPLYKKGTELFIKGLHKNKDLIDSMEDVDGEETLVKDRLLERAFRLTEHTPAARKTFFTALADKTVEYEEPIPGLPIIRVDDAAAEIFYDYGILPDSGDAYFEPGSPDMPSFLIVKIPDPTSEYFEEDQKHREKQVRHETHHFMWNMLTESGFILPTKETGELAEPFTLYRDELAAHMINDRVETGNLWHQSMVYSRDPKVIEKARETGELAYLCTKLAKTKNIDPQTFLYPVMKAQTFQEIKSNIIEITPIDEELTDNDLQILIETGINRPDAEKAVAEILTKKIITVQEAAITKVFRSLVEKNKIRTEGREDVRDILRFFRDSGLEFPDHDVIYRNLRLLSSLDA